jgi:hypothetical protein
MLCNFGFNLCRCLHLVQRHVDFDTICPLCNVDTNDYHVFVLCPEVVASWDAAELSNFFNF